jgi:hypothetical protein
VEGRRCPGPAALYSAALCALRGRPCGLSRALAPARSSQRINNSSKRIAAAIAATTPLLNGAQLPFPFQPVFYFTAADDVVADIAENIGMIFLGREKVAHSTRTVPLEFDDYVS